MFKEACGEDVVGMIDQVQKLEKFLYWSLGSFYRYEDFFHYCCPLIFNVEINHEQVLEPWTLRLKPIQIGFMHRLIQIKQTELMNAIKETKEVYSNYPTDVSRMEEELDRLQKENPKASSFQKKTWIYRIAARDAEVILFPSSPFYAEIDTGREQNSVTASFPPQPGIGCWLMKQYPDFVDGYGEWSG